MTRDRDRGRAVRAAWLVACVTLAAASTSRAQTPAQLAARRVLLDQAQRAAHAEDHARALELAQRAEGIQATPSVREFIAEQLVATGQVVNALGEADACVRESQRDTAMEHRDETLRHCRSMVADLQGRVALLVVDVTGENADLATVHVGTQVLEPTLLGVPVPVDPGTLTITADGPRHAHASRTVTLVGGQSETVALALVAEAAPVVGSVITAAVRLRVHASPPSADIRIDGVFAGAGRAERSVLPGAHRIDVSAPGREPFATSVEAHAGTPIDVDAPLAPLRSTARAANGWVVPVVVTASILVAAGIATGVTLATVPGSPREVVPSSTGTVFATVYDRSN